MYTATGSNQDAAAENRHERGEATDVLAQAIGNPREVGLHASYGANRQDLRSNNVVECTCLLMQ